jgi:hypothetical protein
MSKTKNQINKEYFMYLFGMELTRHINQILEDLSKRYKLPYFERTLMDVKDNTVIITFKFSDKA